MSTRVILLCLGVAMTAINVSTAGTTIPASEIRKLNASDLAKFNTRNLPRSHGLDVDVYYPEFMKFEMGGFQPHTIAKASYEWNDFEVLVQISAAAEDCGKSAVRTLKEGISELDKDDVKEIAETGGGKFLDGGIVNIREVKIIWFDMLCKIDRMGESTLIAMRQYVIPADAGKLFYLRFSVGNTNCASPLDDFNALKPMFKRCAMALTLKQYSQFHEHRPAWRLRGIQE